MSNLAYDITEVLATTTTQRVRRPGNSARRRPTADRQVTDLAGDPHSQTFIERLKLTKRYLDAQEVVELLGIHITTLQLWTKHREIPHLKVGHGVRFDPVELANWLTTRRIGTK